MPANEQPQTNGQTTITALQDAIYGTRNYTSGARYQLPRKVPLRIEPKTYFGEVAEHHGVRRLMLVKLYPFQLLRMCHAKDSIRVLGSSHHTLPVRPMLG